MSDGKNPYAAQIEAYCRDWQDTAEPWSRWEVRDKGGKWHPCERHPGWHPDHEYRRKPDTVVVNGIECNAPLKVAPAIGTVYWLLCVGGANLCTWDGGNYDKSLIQKGIVCATKEDAEALWNAMTAPLRAYVSGGEK